MKPVDVLLILEGTYPYVAGGVSSWVHALISDLPELRFGILYLASSWEARPRKYPLPANLEFIQEISALDLTSGWQADRPPHSSLWQVLEDFHQQLQLGHLHNFSQLYEHLGLPGQRQASFLDLTRGPQIWAILRKIYESHALEAPFIDFYYAWRNSHLPILHLLGAAIPNARVIHTVCTGWAGFLGTLARYRLQRPLLLTEHGIYTNERRIEISQADWLERGASDQAFFQSEMGYFKVLWTRLFEAMGRLTYDHADGIYTLYRGNRELQAQFGAPREKIRIVPNGVRVQRFSADRAPLPETGPLRVGFIGRVVPIKDVKTLIRAAKLVRDQLPRVEFWLLGPGDEDPDYYEECRTLVGLLGLQDGLKFFGSVPVADYYPRLHLQVLTSISEGQPLVILEGYCSGLPCVATRVGACSELIDGLTEDDRQLGPSGLVTPVCNPEATARAILSILGQPEVYEAMATAARARVQRFYDHQQMIAAYRRIYSNFAVQEAPLGGHRI
ncbi:GT4 family glycosyltransferase PelF [bacterium]|nr:GT4 family glycosyltransferase PelF [bacterium]